MLLPLLQTSSLFLINQQKTRDLQLNKELFFYSSCSPSHLPVNRTSLPSMVADVSLISTIWRPSRLRIVRIISTYEKRWRFRRRSNAHLTSFDRPGALGRYIRAIPSQITAVSSTNTPSGNDSSAGSSITSKPSFLQIDQFFVTNKLSESSYLKMAI